MHILGNQFPKILSPDSSLAGQLPHRSQRSGAGSEKSSLDHFFGRGGLGFFAEYQKKPRAIQQRPIKSTMIH
jgi:hypothetical protein